MTDQGPLQQRTASFRHRSTTTTRSRVDDENVLDTLYDSLRRRAISDGSQNYPRQPASRGDSYRSSRSVPDDRMSINPAFGIEESLRTLEIGHTSQWNVRGSVSPTTASFSDQEMDQQQGSVRRMDLALPANDGMNDLRQKLHEIRQLAISTEDKAMRMHILMTQEYTARRGSGLSLSPSSSSNSGDTRSMWDEPAALDVGDAAMPIDPSNPYSLRPGDLIPTISPLPHTTHHENDDGVDEDESPVLGCMHYKRNVKLQCFDCHRWVNCRYCHDSLHDLPFPHNLRRKMTRNMLCMLCQTPQPAAEICISCDEYAAWYYCPKCKLWDNEPNKRIYHCDDCGICRLGEGLGKDYVHCKKCNVCISINTSAAHTCVEGATEGACPLCLDEMFASRAKVVSMPCGHYMHGECYKDLMGVTYKCPVCSKSAVNMELQWRKLDHEIAAQPMPEDDAELEGLLPQLVGQENVGSDPNSRTRRPRTVWIGCNDCGSRCWTAFHWLGLKCHNCDSYNTTQMAPTVGHEETETERLIRQQQIHHHHDFSGSAVLLDAGIGVEDHINVDVLDVPASPSQLAVPASPGSPRSSTSSAASPRRYFVQHEEERRPSFTTPRFSTSSLPTLPQFPEMPRLPRMPNIPNLPNMPNYMPNLPNMPNYMPNLPNMPNLELPRFSPYDMFDSLSRSLSPMRYYLQGLDVQEDERLRRDANRSPNSIRSDPTADATAAKAGGLNGDEVEFWGSDGHFLSGEENEGSDGEHVGDESSSGSETPSDDEMADDGADDDVDPMDLIGHR